MARPRTHLVNDLLERLPPGQVVPAADLLAGLGITRPTLGRLVADAGGAVVRLGRTRATAYAQRQDTPAGSEWPLFRMREDGRLEELGQVVALRGDTFYVQTQGDRPNLVRPPEGDIMGCFPGLPWYLDDLRPQGFLGRTFAHRRGRELGLPEDINRWQLGDTLQALVRAGGTDVGDLLLGGDAVASALATMDTPPDRVRSEDRQQRYPEWATAALEGEDVGSSPGGEQPKFTATVEHDGGRYAALVKFALPGAGEAAERWADLLACEHLALEVLREAGVSAAESSLIQTDSHTFLEVKRFDRSPGTLGRRGFVSLLALSSAYVGDVTMDWGQAGEQLRAQRWIHQETATALSRLHAFGQLIGNTDMHQGNVGFHLLDRGALPLAPAYDMLPMSLAPSRTGVLRATTPLPPVAPRRAGQLDHLQWAAPLAVDFWERVAASGLLRSKVLLEVAGQNAARVRAMGNGFG